MQRRSVSETLLLRGAPIEARQRKRPAKRAFNLLGADIYLLEKIKDRTT